MEELLREYLPILVFLALAVGLGLVLILAAIVLYLVAKPVPFDPAPWTPTPNTGFAGPFTANNLLTSADSILMPGDGPEDLALGPDGKIYTGLVAWGAGIASDPPRESDAQVTARGAVTELPMAGVVRTAAIAR